MCKGRQQGSGLHAFSNRRHRDGTPVEGGFQKQRVHAGQYFLKYSKDSRSARMRSSLVDS